MEQHGIKMKFYQVFKQNKTKIVTSKNPSKKNLTFHPRLLWYLCSTQAALTYSKLTTEILAQGMKYVQS